MAIKVMFALDEFEKGFQHVFVRKDGRQGVARCNRITLTSFCKDFASVACRGGGFQFSRGQQVDGCFLCCDWGCGVWVLAVGAGACFILAVGAKGIFCAVGLGRFCFCGWGRSASGNLFAEVNERGLGLCEATI